jgi:type II restriction/modification system DNA methylase subunit YeeA
MRATDFVRKWSDSTLRERQASQEHFLDLCELLGEPKPAADDPHGDRYCFERGASKTGGGKGWADVWRKGCFGWEYKGKHKDLNAALRQLQTYALDLQNPPYLVVSDMERIVVHTNWTNTVSKRIELTFPDLLDPAKLDILRQVFTGSERLKPVESPQELTAKAASAFGELGRRLQERKHEPRAVAHFLNKLVFCMFAEDVGLLPKGLFSRTVRNTARRPAAAQAQLAELFAKMSTSGDTYFGSDLIRWFNGGLFDGDETLPLESSDLELVAKTAESNDWSQIDPSIFGTLFEQALKATRERPALGAHYTDRAKILKIVDPVIAEPLAAEWRAALAVVEGHLAEMAAADADRRAVFEDAAETMKVDPAAAKAGEAKRRKRLTEIAKRRDAAYGAAQAAVQAYLDRLSRFKVLDPACGSGNFLYVALHALLDLERRAIVDAERLGLTGFVPRVDLSVVRGIEIDRYAAELARLTLWIGYLQWARRNGALPDDPVLSSLDQIENRDALLNPDGTEADWPSVDVIVGNPPFLGGKRMRDGLGDAYVERLFAAYKGRVPAEADFVTYWVRKAWEAVNADGGETSRAGFVTTNSIRGGASRRVLDPIADAGLMMDAWADQPWVLEGAAVRASLFAFGHGFLERRLEGKSTAAINADFTGGGVDLTKAVRLRENAGVAYQGTLKVGAFDISGETARDWLLRPLNPNGRPNSDVIKPWRNGMHLTRRWDDTWVIYFPPDMSEETASFYEEPFRHLQKNVAPMRAEVRRDGHRVKWWIHGEARPGLFKAIKDLDNYIATPRVSKHRLFVWLEVQIIPDGRLQILARSDSCFFGILSSHIHEIWSLATCSWHGVGDDPTYNGASCFETFPFPDGLTPNIPAADYAADPRAIAIAQAAEELNRLREAWLNPPDLVRIEPEVVPGYPDRILPLDEAAAKVLKTRTLTNLYNQRPAWLDHAHRRLDAAVAAAYGWPEDPASLSDDDILARLFALNQARAGAEAPKTRFGFMKGRIQVPEDFDTLGREEIEAMFYGDS